MFNVYKISNNVNDKVYIGVTTRSIEERFQEHKSRIEERNSIHLYQAMKKYGKENFYIELIDTAESKEEMFEKEKYYIKLYDSYNNGYNLTWGGEGGLRIELDDQQIITDYLNGTSTTEIAQQLQVSPNTMCRRLHSYDIELTWHKSPEELYDYVVQEYIRPRLVKDIAAETGMTINQITYCLRKRNIPRNQFTKSYPDGRQWYNEYKQGTSLTQLQNKYGVNRKVLSRIFNYYQEIDKLKI